jgi:hypothetical protein
MTDVAKARQNENATAASQASTDVLASGAKIPSLKI